QRYVWRLWRRAIAEGAEPAHARTHRKAICLPNGELVFSPNRGLVGRDTFQLVVEIDVVVIGDHIELTSNSGLVLQLDARGLCFPDLYAVAGVDLIRYQAILLSQRVGRYVEGGVSFR